MSEVQVNVGTTETLMSTYGHYARVHNQIKGFEDDIWTFDLDGVRDLYGYYTRESAEDAALKAMKSAPEPTTMEKLIERRNAITAQLREKARKTEPKDIVASWGAYDYVIATATDPSRITQVQDFHFQTYADGTIQGDDPEDGTEVAFCIEDWTFENQTLLDEQD